MNLDNLYINKNIVKVSDENKVILLSYGLFSSGIKIHRYERYGEKFLNWLINNPKYNEYSIIIDQSSEPMFNAGIQSNSNGYYWNYKSASKILKDRNVWFISDSGGDEFSKWILKEFGFKVLTYHYHFNKQVVKYSFYNDVPQIRSDEYIKKFIVINGNIENEHKPKLMNIFTELNLWDNSYWSFDKFSNFGMEVFKDRMDLFKIFKNLKPLFDKSFMYIVTETVSDNFYINSDIPMDFMSKTGRALWYPTPFIIVGNMGILKRLRDMGFKTFSDFWDESYDTFENLDDRLNKIQEVLKWINSLSMSELIDMRNKMLPIFEHNRLMIENLQSKENLEISKLFPNLFDYSLYRTSEYIKMDKFKIESKNTIDILYHKILDGGGTTFGINALKSKEVEKYLKKGKVLEICSGPGFMGFYLKANEIADNLYFSDINESNKTCIDSTITFNNLSNVEFIKSDCFENIPKDLKFDTIVSNPPHFKTKRPGGYRNEYEMLISLDSDMKIHKSILENAKNYMHKDSRIILVENCNGVTETDIRKMIDGIYGVEYIEYDSYNFSGISMFYTIVLYLL